MVALLLETVLLLGVVTTVRFFTVLAPVFLATEVFTFLEVLWAFCPPRLTALPLAAGTTLLFDLVCVLRVAVLLVFSLEIFRPIRSLFTCWLFLTKPSFLLVLLSRATTRLSFLYTECLFCLLLYL